MPPTQKARSPTQPVRASIPGLMQGQRMKASEGCKQIASGAMMPALSPRTSRFAGGTKYAAWTDADNCERLSLTIIGRATSRAVRWSRGSEESRG